MKRKNKLIKKIFISLAIIIAISGLGLGYVAYKFLYQPNIDLEEKEYTYLHIPTGSDYQDVKNILLEKELINKINTFKWVADRKNYKNHVNPGRYRLTSDMGNNELINLLRSGEQAPIRLTFNNIRSKEQLAGTISNYIEADSSSIITKLHDPEIMASYGLTPEKAKLMFLPDTYEFYWNTSATQLLDRMHGEYQRFWNNERKETAEDIDLTSEEIGILASIVQLETSKKDEMAKIAGVYINRLNRNMALQADPTVVFATGDFTINRVLNKHLAVDSPYNTYKYRGLPPGPITLPNSYAIDQVLNYEEHNYLYFAAKEDFSGYHNFAKTHSEHINNARKYREALNEMEIMN